MLFEESAPSRSTIIGVMPLSAGRLASPEAVIDDLDWDYTEFRTSCRDKVVLMGQTVVTCDTIRAIPAFLWGLKFQAVGQSHLGRAQRALELFRVDDVFRGGWPVASITPCRV